MVGDLMLAQHQFADWLIRRSANNARHFAYL